MRFERRYIPMMLLVMGVGLFAGVMIMAGHNSPAVGRVVPVLSEAPPGGVQQQATPAPDVVPLPMEEMTVIEPIQATEPQITEAMMRAYERAIFTEVNKRRVDVGLQALIWDDRVATAARFHSSDMAQRNYFEHADPEGVRAGQRLTDAGVTYSRWGENILQPGGPFKVMADVDWWMGSSGHRATILGQYRLTGVGIAIDERWQVYITQNFVS